jgi:hypothetical protein
LNLNDTDTFKASVAKLFKSYDMPLLVTSLQAYCFKPELRKYATIESDQELEAPSTDESVEQFQSLLNQFTSLTAKEEFLRQIK